MLFLIQAGTRALADAPAPLFTNDLVGFVKVLAVLVTVILLPCAATLVYFLKRGPDGDIRTLRTDFNGLGTSVNQLREELAATNARVDMMFSTIAESNRDIMTAIQTSGEAQIRAVHLVEIEVARLQERNNIGDAMAKFGVAIERLLDVAVVKRAT